jgi:hypothetical protein
MELGLAPGQQQSGDLHTSRRYFLWSAVFQ